MGLEDEFAKAAEDVKRLKTKPNDNELLDVYALFKQSQVGDVNTDRPGMFELKAKAKWDAWEKRKGLSQSGAKEEYVKVVKNLISKYGLEG